MDNEAIEIVSNIGKNLGNDTTTVRLQEECDTQHTHTLTWEIRLWRLYNYLGHYLSTFSCIGKLKRKYNLVHHQNIFIYSEDNTL